MYTYMYVHACVIMTYIHICTRMHVCTCMRDHDTHHDNMQLTSCMHGRYTYACMNAHVCWGGTNLLRYVLVTSSADREGHSATSSALEMCCDLRAGEEEGLTGGSVVRVGERRREEGKRECVWVGWGGWGESGEVSGFRL
jgi:hypothetical protein